MPATSHAGLAFHPNVKDNNNNNNKNNKNNTSHSHDSNQLTSHPPLTFYPAYCHKSSPTYFKWIKLTSHDIHHNLTSHPQYKTIIPTLTTTKTSPETWRDTHQTLLLFYLNHPIQFVQLVGIVVSFEEYHEKFWLFTVDDSSGSIIDVSCRKPMPSSVKKEKDEDHTVTSTKKPEPQTNPLYTLLPTLTVGTTVQLKGRITLFRSVRQISLERLTILQTTNQEITLIASRTDFLLHTLSKPWVLTGQEQTKLLKEANGEAEEEDKRVRRRRKRCKLKEVREERHRTRIVREYEREEGERRKGAEEARIAGLMLKRGKGAGVVDGGCV